jgi:predicted secreted protein
MHRFAVLVVLALLASGCTVMRDGSPTPADTDATTTSEERVRDFPLSDHGDDSAVIVAVGEKFTVSVDDNASVGDLWSISEPPQAAVLSADGDHYVADSEEAAPGSGGTRYFEFTVRGTGITTIEFRNCFRGCSQAENDKRYVMSVEAR